jgi:hypothetical protein
MIARKLNPPKTAAVTVVTVVVVTVEITMYLPS